MENILAQGERQDRHPGFAAVTAVLCKNREPAFAYIQNKFLLTEEKAEM